MFFILLEIMSDDRLLFSAPGKIIVHSRKNGVLKFVLLVSTFFQWTITHLIMLRLYFGYVMKNSSVLHPYKIMLFSIQNHFV